jgi:peroxiredoxin
MVSLETPVCEFGLPAVDFSLLDTDKKVWTLDECRGENGLLIMFICNHCPYVQSILDRLVRDTNALKKLGMNTVAIMSNDPAEYPEDGLDNMKVIAEQHQFSFPYLFDETQQVAQADGAVCTPDFYGYNKDLQLQYRGRFDESKKLAAATNVRRDLFEAMKMVIETEKGPEQQIPSMGCSIKWRAA